MMRVLAVMLLVVGPFATSAWASVEEQIKSRIEPVGTVCVDGEDCGDIVTSSAPAAASSGPRSGEEVFTAVCSSCHNAGVMGAPKFGDAGAWAPRIEKGLDTLVDHAVNGFNSMPAKGGCSSCPDEEIQSAVEYMVDNSQ